MFPRNFLFPRKTSIPARGEPASAMTFGTDARDHSYQVGGRSSKYNFTFVTNYLSFSLTTALYIHGRRTGYRGAFAFEKSDDDYTYSLNRLIREIRFARQYSNIINRSDCTLVAVYQILYDHGRASNYC